MSKKYYILESRTYRGNSMMPNKTGAVIGVFSRPELAREWILLEGINYFGARFPKKTFWAVVEHKLNDAWDNCGVLEGFYDKEGGRII